MPASVTSPAVAHKQVEKLKSEDEYQKIFQCVQRTAAAEEEEDD